MTGLDRMLEFEASGREIADYYRFGVETPEKWGLLRAAGLRFGLRTLVETGGYHGGTMEFLQGDFDRLVTIELGSALFDDIYALGIPNVLCLKGDSGRVLAQFLLFFSDPALFWLDAHPSGGDTVGVPTGGVDGRVYGTVFAEELMAVLDRGNKMDVVFVDDVGHPGIERDFIGAIVGRYDGWELRFCGDFPNCIGMVTFRGRLGEDP